MFGSNKVSTDHGSSSRKNHELLLVLRGSNGVLDFNQLAFHAHRTMHDVAWLEKA
jgi:hypothetical protein